MDKESSRGIGMRLLDPDHSVITVSSVACELAPLRIVLLCVFLTYFFFFFTSLLIRVCLQ